MADNIFEIIEAASPRDKILAYLKSTRKHKITLTEIELEQVQKLDYADDLIRNHPAAREKELINMMMEKYEISSSQARNILVDARYVHGSIAKPVKAYERMRVKEFLWKIAIHASGNEDFKVAIQAADLIARLDGLDKPDDEIPDDEQGGVHIIRPAFAPETLGVKLPENIDELVAELRSRTKTHDNILKAING
jgi:hypothetical protein